MVVTFEALRANYPTMPKKQFFNLLGGEWPKLVNNEMYANTCAVRLSYALRGAGVAIPKKYQEAIDGTDASLVLKVATMGRLINDTFAVTWGMSKVEGSNVDIPPNRGIIAYHVKWDDATGHFDLWTGTDFVGSGKSEDIFDGFDISLWSLA
jgi:hypothetical protein